MKRPVSFPAGMVATATILATAATRSGSNLVRFNLLRDALVEGKVVDFMYDGKLRVVEVHAIGVSPKDGNLVMRGFQIGGQASRPLPQWTLFSVPKIELLEIKAVDSGAPREGYALGDQQMSPVIAELSL